MFIDKQKLISKYCKGKILDVGCTIPNPYLKNVIGIDIVKIRKPKNYRAVYVMDCQKMKFPNKSFDTIIAGDVIEHLENPSQFLREAHRILKDDGKLIITTPNPMYPLTILANILFPTSHMIGMEHISVLPPPPAIFLCC